MSHEHENDSFDGTPEVEGDDDLNLSSAPAHVRSALRTLAERRALLRDEKWRSLARGTSSTEEVAVLKETAKQSAQAQALFEIAQPKAAIRTIAPKRRIAQRVGATLLLAAGFAAIWFGMTRAAPMPAYTVAVEGGLAATLGADDLRSERKVYSLSTSTKTILEVTLSPPPNMLVSRYGVLRGQAFLVRFGTVTPLAVPVNIDASGKSFLKGTREELFPGVSNGDYDLWIAIGPTQLISAKPDEILEQVQKKERTLSISRIHVHLDGEPTKTQNVAMLDVSFTGCKEIIAPVDREPALPECHLDAKGKLKLRVKAAPGAMLTGQTAEGKIDADLQLATTEAGTFVEFDVPNPEGDVFIEASLAKERSVFRLPLRQVKRFAAFDAALQLAQKGESDDALAAAKILTGDSNVEIRTRAFGLLGRIDKHEERYDDAENHMQSAIALDRQTGRLSAELSDGTTLSEIRVMHLHDLKRGQEALDNLRPLMASVPEALTELPYYRANIAMQSGDLRQALRLYDQTLVVAEQRGFERIQGDTKFALAEIFGKLGRVTEARGLREEFVDALKNNGGSACDWVDVLNQAGWVEYLASFSPKHENTALDEAKRFYELALGWPCDDGARKANVRTNLALIALARGNHAEVRTQIAEAKKASAKPGRFIEDWWELAESRVLIEEGRTDPNKAKTALQNIESLLGHAQDAEVRLDAWLARAEALDVLGDPAARQAYFEADVDALRYAMGVEFTTGAGSFLTVHGRATERRIDYLLRLAEKEPKGANDTLREAVEASRRSRLRGLVSLPGRMAVNEAVATKRGELTAAIEELNRLLGSGQSDANARRNGQRDVSQKLARLLESIGIPLNSPLSPPTNGELLLVYHPLGAGYVGFAIDDQDRIVAKRIDVASAETRSNAEMSARMLEPFRAQIEVARRIRFAPHGANLARVDFHALPWGDGKLVEAMPVAYAIDLGGLNADASPDRINEHSSAMIVVGDPQKTLPGATREAEAVEKAIRERLRYEVKNAPTISPENMEAFRSTLAEKNLRLFHFVGHGYFQSLANKVQPSNPIYRPDLDGWESGVRLGNGGLFSARQVLELEHVPPFVILSACEVGSLVDEADGLSFGLPQAFIVKGARAVVAATLPLPAAVDGKRGLHEKLVEKMYASTSFPEDLPAALRDAQMQLLLESEWASFRVFVP